MQYIIFTPTRRYAQNILTLIFKNNNFELISKQMFCHIKDKHGITRL